MARKGNLISVRRDLNRSSDSSRFSDRTRRVTIVKRAIINLSSLIMTFFFFYVLGYKEIYRITTPTFLIIFSLFLIATIFLFHFYIRKRKTASWEIKVLYLMLFFFISLFLIFLRLYVGQWLSILAQTYLIWSMDNAGMPGSEVSDGREEINSNTSGSGPSNSSDRRWRSFDEGVLLEPFSASRDRGTGEPSVNNNPLEGGNDAVAPDVVRYQYQDNEIIGGDCVEAIKRRLLFSREFPTPEQDQWAKNDAEDLFEVKVEIVRKMAVLDPTGDWMGQGARALDNPHTATGEPSLKKLYELRDDLERDGVNSLPFATLKEKVRLRPPGGGDSDANSSA